ncbi:hypothetical protein JXA85_07175 [Candidatus Woesearchaeota archaeon]|nr:hypothetical protein [Candidatus Woesearchaeota archaeon]
MKHTLRITFFLIAIFILAQLMGILIVGQYVDVKKSAETGITQLNKQEYIIEPPRLQNESMSFVYISIAIIIGTLLVLLIIRFRKRRVWKAWYFMSVVICLMMAFSPFVRKIINSFFPSIINYYANISLGLALILGIWKISRPNPIIHNLTEIFIYGGIAALLVPIINLFSGIALLIVISLYDMYAVWKSKHMVTMAKFQSNEKVFAGLFIPYARTEKPGKKMKKDETPVRKSIIKEKTISEPSNAILGGGDIAFPLLFSSAVLKTTGLYLDAILITIFSATALFTLLYFSKKDRFYPAMPFISLGCFLGFLVSLIF